MSTRMSTGLSIALLAVTIAGVAAGYVLVALTWSTTGLPDLSGPRTTAINLAGALAFSLVGTLIASRRPRHLIGWLFLGGGVFMALQGLTERYVVYAFITNPGSLPLPRFAASLLGATWMFTLTLIVLLVLLFPSGQPESRRWRLVAYGAVLASVIGYSGFMLEPGPLTPPFETIDNAFGVSALEGIEVVGFVGLVTLFALTLASTVGAILRFRRSQGDEREQFKWFVAAASFIPVIIALHSLADAFATSAVDTVESLFGLIFVLIPVAVGFAVLKYRLYDIDVLINRTLVYLPLTGILAGLYVAMTGLSRTLFTSLTDAGSDAAIALSTLAVVAVLTPLKNQLQALVDRYFKEQRDPAKEVRRLAGQARAVLQVVDTQEFVQRFLGEVAAAVEAPGAAIELSNGATPQRITAGDWSGDAALSLPLQRNGYELGSLALSPRPGSRAYDEDEREALQESADVLAHALSLGHLSVIRDA